MMHHDPSLAEAPRAIPPLVEQGMKIEMGELWQTKVKEFREENRTRAAGGIIFCGDSITAGFPVKELLPACPIANRGISGDSIVGLIRRLDVSAYELRPRQLYLLIGINDIVFSEMTVRDYRAIYDYLFGELRRQCPDCRVYVQSILPVRGKFAKHNSLVRDVNRELKALARKHGMTYIDLQPVFSDENGEMKVAFSEDGVHPNRKGYEAWVKVLARSLAKP